MAVFTVMKQGLNVNKYALGLLEGNGSSQERLGTSAGVCLALAGTRRPLSFCSSLVIVKV